MAKAAKPIPDGYHTLTPHLVVQGADKAIDFYKKAFGAHEVCRMPDPQSGKIHHAELKIGDSHLFLCDDFPEMGGPCTSPARLGGSAVTLSLYVENTDAIFNQAVAAGAKALMPPADMFWGDRYCKLTDPFGHVWAVMTHLEDLTPEEMGQRAQAAFAQMGQPGKS